MSKDLKSKIKKQVEDTGLPFELLVAEMCRNQGWKIKHNQYYVDFDEQKGREIDLLVEKTHMTDSSNYLEMSFELVIEIKDTSQHPWVFLCTPSTGLEKMFSLPLKQKHSQHSFSGNVVSTLQRDRKNLLHPVLGRTYIAAFKNNNNDEDKFIYSALCGVVKAQDYLHQTFDPGRSTDRIFQMFEPVIVVKKPLFKAELANGEIEVEEVEHIQYLFNYRSDNYKPPHGGHIVHIITFDFLETFLQTKEKEHERHFELIKNLEGM